MKRTIFVTNKHINDGRTKSCTECPLALAMRDAGLVEPSVYQQILFWKKENNFGISRQHSWATPWRISRFIKRFDNGKKVRPFSFTLEISECT